MESEEKYLIQVSDKNAAAEIHNFTDSPHIIWFIWRARIHIEVLGAYVKKFGLKHYRQILAHDANYFEQARPVSGYYNEPKMTIEKGAIRDAESKDAIGNRDLLPNERALISDTIHKRHEVFKRANGAGIPSLWQLVIRERKIFMVLICYPNLVYPLRQLMVPLYLVLTLARGQFGQVRDVIIWCLRKWMRLSINYEYKSLRRIVERDLGGSIDTNAAMEPLRRGR